MEAAWSITDLPPAAPGILLLLLLVDLGLLGSSFFAILNNLNTFDHEMATDDTRICLHCTIGQKAITPINAFKFASIVFFVAFGEF